MILEYECTSISPWAIPPRQQCPSFTAVEQQGKRICSHSDRGRRQSLFRINTCAFFLLPRDVPRLTIDCCFVDVSRYTLLVCFQAGAVSISISIVSADVVRTPPGSPICSSQALINSIPPPCPSSYAVCGGAFARSIRLLLLLLAFVLAEHAVCLYGIRTWLRCRLRRRPRGALSCLKIVELSYLVGSIP